MTTTTGTPPSTTSTKVRENRVRRIAARRGYVLSKSRRRDPEATDYSLWTVAEDDGTTVYATTNRGIERMQNVQLHHVEAFLAGTEVNFDDWR
ncbi:hypothetical protein [Arsenicicoccus dermatophilus]|uniref:hypothetical protein n=1 Tax=Arsenicicoccus dermatophilus TaxID=1076331 RepID=UPI0039174123